MANRTYIDRQYSIAKGRVVLHCAVSVGAAGAVTLQDWNYPQMGQTSGAARTYTSAPTSGGTAALGLNYAVGSEGVYSVARTAAGLWTITLQDAYQRVLDFNVVPQLSGGLSAIVGKALDSSITNMNSGTPPRSVIGIALLSATATALDPANGETIFLTFTLQNLTTP